MLVAGTGSFHYLNSYSHNTVCNRHFLPSYIISIGKTYTTLGPATSPDFFSPQSSGEKHSQEYDAVGILPRALRDLFLQLEKKRQSLDNNRVENSDPAAELNCDAINGHGSPSGSIGIAATKSPAPPKQSDSANKQQKRPFEYQVKLQFLELYGEEIRDLLTQSLSSQTNPEILANL